MQISVSGDDVERLVNYVERLVSERASGRRLVLSELDPLIWEGIVIWDQSVAAHERAHQSRIADICEMIGGLTKRG